MRKEELLQKLRANTKVQYDMPAMDDLLGITYADAYQQFVEMTKTVGGRIVEARKTDDLNQIIRNLYPDAKVFLRGGGSESQRHRRRYRRGTARRG